MAENSPRDGNRLCLDPEISPSDLEADNSCRCRAAVTRSYFRMRDSGAAEQVALDVATRVYRHYHPEIAGGTARNMVEILVYTGPMH